MNISMHLDDFFKLITFEFLNLPTESILDIFNPHIRSQCFFLNTNTQEEISEMKWIYYKISRRIRSKNS